MKKNSSKSNDFLVAIPFGNCVLDVSLRKVSQWNVLDLIIVRRIAQERLTLDNLEIESGLNRQLLIQIVLPFIKLDWITLVQDGVNIFLQITKLGLTVADLKSLPNSPKKINTKRELIVNLINGDHKGLINNNINLYNYHQIKEFEKNYENFVFIEDVSNKGFHVIDCNKSIKCILKDDEEIESYSPPVNMFFNSSDYKFVVFNVKKVNGIVHSFFKTKFDNELSEENKNIFSTNELNQISNFISEKLSNRNKNEIIINNDMKNEFKLESNYEFSVLKDNTKLLLGAKVHLEAFYEVFNTAKNYVVIHSTFIGKWNFDLTMGTVISSLKRGVTIYLLWGKDQFDNEDKHFNEIREYFENIERDYYGLFFLHKIQTGSHAKFIIYDNDDSDFTSIIGSCNWFYTNFDRYEGSVLIRDNDFSKKLLNITASLATGRSYLSNELTLILSTLSNQIPSSKKIEKLEINNTAKVNLLLKSDHYTVLNLAQRAKERIYILSDKISYNINRAVWEGLKNSKAKKIKAWYTSDSENLSHEQIQKFSDILRKDINQNIVLKNDTSKKKNHSKIIAWDKDHIVISSLNWLSANSSFNQASEFDNNHEIGVYINYPKIEQEFVKHFYDH